MPLGMDVGLSPGDFVLDGDPPTPFRRSTPIFGPCLLWPNGWTDQDGTWHGSRPWFSRHGARWRHSSHPQKRGQSLPQFLAHLYCGQTAGCIKIPLGMEVGLSPGDFMLNGEGPHLYSPGRPSRWALAHISSFFFLLPFFLA